MERTEIFGVELKLRTLEIKCTNNVNTTFVGFFGSCKPQRSRKYRLKYPCTAISSGSAKQTGLPITLGSAKGFSDSFFLFILFCQYIIIMISKNAVVSMVKKRNVTPNTSFFMTLREKYNVLIYATENLVLIWGLQNWKKKNKPNYVQKEGHSFVSFIFNLFVLPTWHKLRLRNVKDETLSFPVSTGRSSLL